MRKLLTIKFMDCETVMLWTVYLKLLEKLSRSPPKQQTEDWNTNLF